MGGMIRDCQGLFNSNFRLTETAPAQENPPVPVRHNDNLIGVPSMRTLRVSAFIFFATAFAIIGIAPQKIWREDSTRGRARALVHVIMPRRSK